MGTEKTRAVIVRNFVVFEGGDGSGTTTQLEMLRERFFSSALYDFPRPDGPMDGFAVAEPFAPEKGGLPALWTTFEPTEGPIGRVIRSGLKKEISLESETIARLFAADRNEHLWGPGGIVERCKKGELVVCDRYTPSSLVYQGITCGEELPRLLNRDFPVPELLLFFDLDPETAQKRMKDRPQKEIYEALEFQIQVRERYKALLPRLRDEGVRVETIDASRPVNEVQTEVWRFIQNLPIFKR